MLKTLLVAVDCNPESSPSRIQLSQQIIRAVKLLQLTPDSQIILSHVIPATSSDVEVAADRPQNTDLEEIPYRHIEKQLQSYQDELPCKSSLEIVAGDPAEEIIRLANIYQADLILIGSRGLTGLNRILKGSVSSQVVEEALCSVLVIKPHEII